MTYRYCSNNSLAYLMHTERYPLPEIRTFIGGKLLPISSDMAQYLKTAKDYVPYIKDVSMRF